MGRSTSKPMCKQIIEKKSKGGKQTVTHYWTQDPVDIKEQRMKAGK